MFVLVSPTAQADVKGCRNEHTPLSHWAAHHPELAFPYSLSLEDLIIFPDAEADEQRIQSESLIY